jgi:hypothetical protein
VINIRFDPKMRAKTILSILGFINSFLAIPSLVIIIMYFNKDNNSDYAVSVIIGLLANLFFGIFICMTIRDGVVGEEGVPGPVTCFLPWAFLQFFTLIINSRTGEKQSFHMCAFLILSIANLANYIIHIPILIYLKRLNDRLEHDCPGPVVHNLMMDVVYKSNGKPLTYCSCDDNRI